MSLSGHHVARMHKQAKTVGGWRRSVSPRSKYYLLDKSALKIRLDQN